ncbi:MAG: cytochrome c [Acidobacteria bacterium]|nr:cytochrome c [Acidobacteriota bacterium]
MKLTLTALIVLWTAALGLNAAEPRVEQEQSTNSGVYSEVQAKRGEATYTQACASCHGGQLEGDGFAPALTGPEFMANWTGTTVGDLFERIRVSMPPGQESSVGAQDKIDVVGFILKANQFPAGQSDLAKETEGLKQIKFEPKQ